ncbi:hypothetical protein BT96DRAFT_920090, partial [Gymnopus androsaceus JB14]
RYTSYRFNFVFLTEYLAPKSAMSANFQLRTNMDLEEIRRRLRSEYGSGVQSEAEISGVLADVDKDLEDCDAEFRRLQSRMIALQNQRKRLAEHKVFLALSAVTHSLIQNSGPVSDLNCGRNLVVYQSYRRTIEKFVLSLLHAVIAGRSSPRDTPKSIQPMTAQNPSDFPLLEQLLIPNIAFNNEKDLNRFQHAANLKVLALSDIVHWADLQQRKFLWAQITELDVAQCEDMMKHILEMHSLQELHFKQFPDNESTVILCSPPVATPSVQKLALTLRQTSHLESERLANVVFASITCPNLTSLFVEGKDGYKDPWPRDMVNGFISRSSFHLTTLSIKFIPLSDSDLIDLLRRLPSLHHLTVNDSNITSPSSITPLLIQSLHAFHQTSPVAIFTVLVKRLQTLSLTTSAEAQEAFNDRDFVDMVSSRWFLDGYKSDSDSMNLNGGMACLRSVVMRFTKRDVDEEVYRPLKYIEEEGMRVVVIGRNS